MKGYYMVMAGSSKGGRPTVRHETFQDAIAEAKRLAMRENGVFYVLYVCGEAKRVDVQYENYK